LAYRMLAFDYDETLADGGVIHPDTVAALATAKAAGWMLAIVTGRPHDDLLKVFPQCSLCDLLVVDNGGVMRLAPAGSPEELAPRPDPRLREEFRRLKVPFLAGAVATITRRSHERETFEVIRGLGLEADLDTFINRIAIMIVPRGTSKATGFRAALERMGVARSEVIAFGDDRNDVEFLRSAGLRVAVANAIDDVKAAADLVTDLASGAGVTRFIHDRVIASPHKLPPPHSM
jgi:hydroxymethylpyrimidine pyrophosphatase-like HAD family hydrolase